MNRPHHRKRLSRRNTAWLLLLAIAAGFLLFRHSLSAPGQDSLLPPQIPSALAPCTGTAAEKVKAYAERNHIPFEMYPAELIDLLERNPETETFVLEYPWHETQKVGLSEYDRSAGVPLFLQWDLQWGYTPYGSGMLAITGCGPTCLAMAGYYLTGDSRFTPDQMASFALENGYYSYGNGSCWTLISEGAPQLGLDVRELPLDYGQIEESLADGRPIICVVGPGDFTADGHFLVIAGAEDGMLTVNDPNSIANSQKTWDYNQLAPQIENLWSVGI